MNDNIIYCTQLRGMGYWENRISKEIEFAQFLTSINPSLSHTLLEEVAQKVVSFHKEQGSITKDVVVKAEEKLISFAKEAKSFTIDCVGHAHIDMNWMWGLDETVSIVLDTFRTMLILMDEYPHFTFAQSQASTYHIVERYEPEMLPKIRKRVKEGRWEVTASAWTEFDKNMASGESHLRQYSMASDYICTLLDLDPKELCVGFEPDTFGHNARLPDILNMSGIQYYYHCRGKVEHTLYRWRGPQGGQVLVFREPSWYLGPTVTPLNDPSKGTLKALEMDMAGEVAKMYKETGIRRMLQIYGVGDHGGGPTRIDIEGLQDIASWPCYPDVIFSTIQKFFTEVATHIENVPLVTGEINSIFPGCYTSQSAIKRGNHESEKMLYEAEFYAGVTTLSGGCPLSTHALDQLHDGWKDLFFNQFHDILPGSCTSDSKSYALGVYQTIYARANSMRTSSLRALAHNIDTSAISIPHLNGQRSMGGGVGYQTHAFKVSPVGDVEGNKRIVTLFNATSSPRNEVVQVVLWDWEDVSREIACTDDKGNEIVVVAQKEQVLYWQHSATILSLLVDIPPFSHASYIFYSSDTPTMREDGFAQNPRMEASQTYVLENDTIKATFSPHTLELVSLVDTKTKEELLSSPSGLMVLDEDTTEGMSSWKVGREGTPNQSPFNVKDVFIEINSLYQSLSFTLTIRQSKISLTYTMDSHSSSIKCNADIVWREVGDENHTPQLSFALHLKGTRESYLYDIPFGTILRDASTMHVPALSWIAGDVGNSVIQLVGRGKYGYCGTPQSMRVILLRSSSEPDMFPEVGEGQQECTIVVHPKNVTHKQMIESGIIACNDIQQVTHGQHSGNLAMNTSYVEVDGPFVVSSIHLIQQHDVLEIRGFESEGKEGKVAIHIPFLPTPCTVSLIGNDRKVQSTCHLLFGESYTFTVVPHGVCTLRASFIS